MEIPIPVQSSEMVGALLKPYVEALEQERRQNVEQRETIGELRQRLEQAEWEREDYRKQAHEDHAYIDRLLRVIEQLTDNGQRFIGNVE